MLVNSTHGGGGGYRSIKSERFTFWKKKYLLFKGVNLTVCRVDTNYEEEEGYIASP